MVKKKKKPHLTLSCLLCPVRRAHVFYVGLCVFIKIEQEGECVCVCELHFTASADVNLNHRAALSLIRQEKARAQQRAECEKKLNTKRQTVRGKQTDQMCLLWQPWPAVSLADGHVSLAFYDSVLLKVSLMKICHLWLLNPHCHSQMQVSRRIKVEILLKSLLKCPDI